MLALLNQLPDLTHFHVLIFCPRANDFCLQNENFSIYLQFQYKQIIYSSIQSTKIKVSSYMQIKLYKKSRIAFRTQNKIAFLNFALQSNQHSSNSFVLSLAQYLNALKGIVPPGLTPLLKKKSSSHAKLGQSEPSYFEPWCDYLFGLIADGNIINNDDQLILVGKIDEQNFKAFETINNFEIKDNAFSTQKKQALLQTINLLTNSQQSKVPEIRNRIAIINFSTSSINQDKLKPKIHIDGIFSGIFYNPGDQWRSYKILKNEIPKVEELALFDTVILSGSSYSVNNMAPQMEKFKDILLDALRINNKLKILGICFGHQFIAKSNNIQVVTKPLNKGLENINFQIQNSSEIEYLNHFIKSQIRYLRLYKYHNDHVTSSPQHFGKFGESSKCNVQSLISLDKRVLSFQFHPQYTEQYIHAFEQRAFKYFRPEHHISKHITRDDFHHKSVDIIRKTMRSFMNWTIEI